MSKYQSNRECTNRFAIVEKEVQRFDRPFTVLDIGANCGYFSLRLAIENPESVIVAIEKNPQAVAILLKEIEKHNLDNIVVLSRPVTQKTLWHLTRCEHFDITLALSVAHWIPGPVNKTIDLMSQTAWITLLEPAKEKRAINPDKCKNTLISPSWKNLGETDAQHISPGTVRNIYRIVNPRTMLPKLSWERKKDKYNSGFYCTFETKEFVSLRKRERRNWIPGINLWTALQLGLAYPFKEDILASITQNRRHKYDEKLWNFILTKGGPQAIDIEDAARENSLINKVSEENFYKYIVSPLS